MHTHPLHAGIRILLAIAGTIAVLGSLAIEYPFYRMLLVMIITTVILLAIL